MHRPPRRGPRRCRRRGHISGTGRSRAAAAAAAAQRGDARLQSAKRRGEVEVEIVGLLDQPRVALDVVGGALLHPQAVLLRVRGRLENLGVVGLLAQPRDEARAQRLWGDPSAVVPLKDALDVLRPARALVRAVDRAVYRVEEVRDVAAHL